MVSKMCKAKRGWCNEDDKKVFLDASQFEHKGPLKINVEPTVKIDPQAVTDSGELQGEARKHFAFADMHEVYDIGPEVEVVA